MMQLPRSDQLKNLYKAQEKLEDVINLLQATFAGTKNENHADAYIIGHLRNWLNCEAGGNSGIAQYIYDLERQCPECGHDRDECECHNAPLAKVLAPVCPECGSPMPPNSRARVCPDCGEDANDLETLHEVEDNERQDLAIEAAVDANREILDAVQEAYDAAQDERMATVYGGYAKRQTEGNAPRCLTDEDFDDLVEQDRQGRDDQKAIEELSHGL